MCCVFMCLQAYTSLVFAYCHLLSSLPLLSYATKGLTSVPNLLFLYILLFPDSYLAGLCLLCQGVMATISYMSYLQYIIHICLTY
jgi:hypothetical protein